MAHFAKIDENNRVLTVLTLNNEDMLNAESVETESVGQQYLETHNNWPSHLWIQTSYNTTLNQHRLDGTPFRGNFACVGYTWDSGNQIFWPPQPYASWTKNLTTADWDPPVARPALTSEQEADTANSYAHVWNEDTQSWEPNVTPIPSQ
jgi:hypothetical protein